MRYFLILLVFVVFLNSMVTSICASENNDCATLSSFIARNFCTSLEMNSFNHDSTTLEPIPDPISVGGFTGFSCRFGIWVDQISHWISNSAKFFFQADTSLMQHRTPQLASAHIQVIDITINRKNVVCVPVEMDSKSNNHN